MREVPRIVNNHLTTLNMNQIKKTSKAWFTSNFPKWFKMLVWTVLLISGLFFTSCSKEPNVEISLAIDKSGSAGTKATELDSTEEIMKALKREMNLSSASSQGCKIRICAIGHSIRPTTYVVTLDQGSFWLFSNKKKRQKEIDAFLQALKATVNEVMNIEANQTSSQIYHTICHQAKILSESKFGTKKSLIIISDGLQSGSGIEFISYANDIEKFKQSFPEFRRKLQQSCSIPNMAGISIMLCNSPNHSLGDLVSASDIFWAELISEVNGTLIIKSNLNS